jgi:predicted nucleic-acid-binding Zn-ribbon protein
MTTHEVRHRLNKINKYLVESLRSCGYTKDYEEAIKNTISLNCALGDDLGKITGEERV